MAVAAALTLGSAPVAGAAEPLRDPDAPAAAAKPSSSSGDGQLPMTGIDSGALLLGGVTLLAAGIAVVPARRRRRQYRSDVWRHHVGRARA